MHNQLRILIHFGYGRKVLRQFQLNIFKRWKSTCQKVSFDKTPLSTSYPHWDILHSETAYNPALVESHKLCKSLWDRLDIFNPNTMTLGNRNKSVVSMILPPPNVTGSLHVGHALTCAVQDAIARCYRMQGKAVVWVPGMDHAGIATQSVVERNLVKCYTFNANSNKLAADKLSSPGSDTQLSNPRLLLGREAFLNRVWDWKNEHAKLIREQLDSLGLCLDWSREFFTLSPNHSRCVTEAFLRLYNAGLIYHAESFISWCCHLQTAISDIEVESRELTGSTFIRVPGYAEPVEFGIMDYFAYHVIDPPVNSSSKFKRRQFDFRLNEIVVATTRLETMLADVALVVHPEDKRYQHLIGCHVQHPFCPNKRILPIIADGEFVQPEIGTGVVKLSPGHSPIDWQVAKRYQLPIIHIFDDSGCILNTVVEFVGLPRFQARHHLVEKLSELGLYKGRQDIGSNGGRTVLPVCSRSGDIIEPMIRKQWFVRTKELAEAAVKVVQCNQMELIPSYQKLVWSEWLSPENHKDWCISRQLWWGHPIPAYKVTLSNPASTNEKDQWIIAHSFDEVVSSLIQSGLEPNDYQIIQDPDVLDTWFSSALLPFSVFGWPNHTEDFRFYPLRMLETGQDILFFWVARMVMLGIFLTGQVPFKTVLLHGLVCDSTGQKMSKSKGNVINPLKIIHGTGNLSKEAVGPSIQVLGADALRAALLTCQLHQPHIHFDEKVVLEMRKFCNKIWQTARFVLIQLQRQDLIQSVSNTHHQPLEFQWISHVGELNRENKLRLFDVWIIHKLHRLIRLINLTWTDPEDKDTDDSDYRRIQEKSTADDGSLKWSFHHGVKGIQNWWMNDLCSTYLEVVKSGGVTPSNTNSLHVLYLCLMTGIHLLHPIMPHLTEVLWHGLRISTECKDNEFYIPENCLLMQTFPNTDWFEFLHQKPNVSLEVVEATMSELTMIATNINSWRPLLRFIDHVESSKNKGVESNDLYLMKIFKHRDDNGNNTSTISEDESSVLKALTCINVKSDMSKKKNDDNNLSHNYVYIPVHDDDNNWQLCINKNAYDIQWSRKELGQRIDKLNQRRDDLMNIGKRKKGMRNLEESLDELTQTKIQTMERKIEKLERQLLLLK